jgi:hypothetical protein
MKKFWAACAWTLVMVVSGCSGVERSDGDSSGPPAPPPPTGTTTLNLTARDAFDEPVPDAEIGLLRSSGTGYLEISTRTGADGRADGFAVGAEG